MWTFDQLEEYFNRNGVSADSYSFYKKKEDCFCIRVEKNQWVIYYVERGKEIILGMAANESMALNILKLFVMESEVGFKKS